MYSSIRRTVAPLAAVALAVGVLTACGDDDPAEFDSPPGTGQSPQDAGDDDEDGDDEDGDDEDGADEDKDAEGGDAEGADGDGADAEGTPTDSGADSDGQAADGNDPPGQVDDEGEDDTTYVRGPDDAVETITYELPDRDLDVTVGLHTLRVDGDVMLLELSFTPEGGDGSTHGFNNFNMGRSLNPLLNDRENLKQYRVLGSGGDRWSTDSTVSSTQIESGQTIMYYAHYAAPQDDIDTINITVIDGLVEFADAEIEW